MKKDLLMLVRISVPKFNETLYNDHSLYMNNQTFFRKSELTAGQNDYSEGQIANGGVRLFYQKEENDMLVELHGIEAIHKKSNICVYCMYSVVFNPDQYDQKSDTYYHYIPWNFIKEFWTSDECEMLVIRNTSVFLKSFREAAEREMLSCQYGLVQYDLEKEINNPDYFEKSMSDRFLTVFHKNRSYEYQNEFRLAVETQEEKSHYVLDLGINTGLVIDKMTLIENNGVLIKIHGLRFGLNGNVLSYSNNVSYSLM
jgi:hypothetical protein